MNKICYICGREIPNSTLYYKVGPQSYICDGKWCYSQYVWDMYAAQYATDHSHKYAVIGGEGYVIGDDSDSPKGYSGRYFTIRFFDGVSVTTSSLWSKGTIPAKYLNVLKENAKFTEMEDL